MANFVDLTASENAATVAPPIRGRRMGWWGRRDERGGMREREAIVAVGRRLGRAQQVTKERRSGWGAAGGGDGVTVADHKIEGVARIGKRKGKR